MENHPIPQDVTGFQFKLIGDMTVKQFAYIAAGAIFSWIVFSTPIFFLFKIFIVFLSFGMGAALAFLPLEGRPFDLMIMLFIKSLFKPNQFIFHKQGAQLFFMTFSPKKTFSQKKGEHPTPQKEKLEKLLTSVKKEKKGALDEKEMVFFESLGGIFNGPVTTATPTFTAQPIPRKEEKKEDEEKEISSSEEETIKIKEEEIEHRLEKEEEALKKELQAAKQEALKNEKSPNSIGMHEKVLELEKQLNEVLGQREQLEKELLKLKQKLEVEKSNVFLPSSGNQPKQESQNVRTVPKGMGKTIGLAFTPDVPNLIIGIVKDPRGNVLPNILVEVKDRDGNPVRAFKTNGVGQFASATPLLNGVYSIWFEDSREKNKFDPVEITLTGEIVPIIEAISADEREELRKALFS